MKKLFGLISETERINNIISRGAATRLSDKEFMAIQIREWKSSKKRKEQIEGEKYYSGYHDILKQKRIAIGRDGKPIEVTNLPNSKLIDNQYAKMVDQKANYLVGKPVTFQTEDKAYGNILSEIFKSSFYRIFRNVGEDSINGGVGWMMPLYDGAGELTFKRFEPYEILPFWADADHTILDAAVHLYESEEWEGSTKRIKERVEIFTLDGVHRYILDGTTLREDTEDPYSPYVLAVDGTGEGIHLNWDRIPLIAWKFNAKEIPLIRRIKSLQDAINLILSVFENNMLEDPRNTILVIVNYDGQDLGEFRQNLATYGAVKVKDIDGKRGDVKSLTVEVNCENYKSILKLLKDALIENARGYDAKDDRLNGQPNEMNIQSMYSDIDLDANSMETEYQAAFEELLWFVNAHLSNTGKGDFDGREVKIIFNRDAMINTGAIIEQCAKSDGQISQKTKLAHHPWVEDVEAELGQIKKEQQEEVAIYPGVEREPGGEIDVEEK